MYSFKILHHRHLYINRPDPMAFLPAAVDTTGRLCDDFSRLLFRHAHRETSVLTNEIPEESGQFRFLRVVSYTNIKGSVGLILSKTSVMRISISAFLTPYSFSLTFFFSLWTSPFFILLKINKHELPVTVRRVDPLSLVFCLSSHRQSYIGLLYSSRFIDL